MSLEKTWSRITVFPKSTWVLLMLSQHRYLFIWFVTITFGLCGWCEVMEGFFLLEFIPWTMFANYWWQKMTFVFVVHSYVNAYNYCYNYTYKTYHENILNGIPCLNTRWSFTYNEDNNPSLSLSHIKMKSQTLWTKHIETCTQQYSVLDSQGIWDHTNWDYIPFIDYPKSHSHLN